jgi:outer membrane protein assembly factor BamB
MNKIKLGLAVLMLCSFAAALYAADAQPFWPNWRGPEFTGVAPGSKPPTVWSETQNIKWKVKLTGDGSNSSPIVWKDKIFFQTAVKTDKSAKEAPSVSAGIDRSLPVPSEPISQPLITAAEMAPPPGQGGQMPPPPPPGMGPPPGGPQGQRPPRGGGGMSMETPTHIYKFNLVCMDRNTGNVLWEKTVCEVLPHQGIRPDHGFASFSPVTDGKYVWANFGSRGLYCYDFDGKLIWNKDLVQMKTRFGEGGSLALAGDAVVVVTDNENESFIWAFNKTTGDILWKKQRDEKTSHATPLVVKVNDRLQIITSATDKIRAYDAKTGDVIWECGGMTQNVIPTPVAGFDMVFCTSGFRGSMLEAIKLGKTGDLTGTDAVAWQVKEATPYVPSPLLYGQRLYLLSVNTPILSCYDAKTGKPFYTKQNLDQIKDIYASLVGAADKVYCVGRNGVTYVLKNADTLEVVSINKLDDGIDCTPAIVDNEIFLKGKQYMYCIAEKK